MPIPRGMRPRLADLALGVAIAAAGVALVHGAWSAPVRWTPDALFYEAQALELQGVEAREARRLVWLGPRGDDVRATEGGVPASERRFESEEWIEYNAPIYRRRWLVPALAAAVQPAAGERSLVLVSLTGYVLAGVLVFALVRRRFSRGVSAGVALTALALPSLRHWSAFPLTDSWGIALTAAALLAASLVLDRGLRWLPLWAGAIGALTLTRDVSAALLLGAAWLALRERSRRAAALLTAGAAAALPALLLFDAPLRRTLAIGLGRGRLPESESWGAILGLWWPSLRETLRADWYVFVAPGHGLRAVAVLLACAVLLFVLPPSRGRRLALIGCYGYLALVLAMHAFPPRGVRVEAFPAGLLFLAGLAFLALPRPRDALLTFARATALGLLGVLVVLPNATLFRLELALLPAVALGLAYAVSRPAPGTPRPLSALASRLRAASRRPEARADAPPGAVAPAPRT